MAQGENKAVDSRCKPEVDECDSVRETSCEADSAATSWELSATRIKIKYSDVQSSEKEQADMKFISFY
jgi:hypothetical protein